MANQQPTRKERAHQDITGQKFHRLLAVSKIRREEKPGWFWECLCDCGNQVVVATSALTAGQTKSCGCWMREKASIRMAQRYPSGNCGIMTVEHLAEIKTRFAVAGEVRIVAEAEGYAITDCGRLFSCRHTPTKRDPLRELLGYEHQYGYRVVTISVAGRSKHRLCHHLVADAFLDPPTPDQTHCRHLDGNPANNHVSNLKWGTPTENVADTIRHGRAGRGDKSPNPKLTNRRAALIRGLMEEDFRIDIVASLFGVSEATVGRVAKGEIWTEIDG